MHLPPREQLRQDPYCRLIVFVSELGYDPVSDTHLIPSLPQSFAEVEHYNDLYQFLPEHVSDPEE